MSELENVAVMTPEEAESCCRRIDADIASACGLIVELHDRKGWKALGYQTWRDCVKERFKRSWTTIYRRLEVGRVMKELDATFSFPNSGNSANATVSESSLSALAKAPEGSRAEVLSIATAASNGKPTESVVKAAVGAKWDAPDALPGELVEKVKAAVAKPKPNPKAKPRPRNVVSTHFENGRLVKTLDDGTEVHDASLASPVPEPEPEDRAPNCIVNGVPAYDADVAERQADGRIPADVIVRVDQPAEEYDAAASKEAAVETKAKEDDLADDEWLATLPLSSRLSGRSLAMFRFDAIHFRRLEPTRRHLLKANGHALNEARDATGGRKREGHVQAAVSWFLRVEHPSRWHMCPPTDKGGCDGECVIPVIGTDCDMCKGRGYLAR